MISFLLRLTLSAALIFVTPLPALADRCCEGSRISHCNRSGFFQCRDGTLSGCECNVRLKRTQKRLPRALPTSVKRAPRTSQGSTIDENEFIKEWCKLLEGDAHYQAVENNPDIVVDCQTEDYSVEVASAADYQHALGKALYISSYSKSKPGIVLLLQNESESAYLQKLKRAVQHHGIKIKVWKAFNSN